MASILHSRFSISEAAKAEIGKLANAYRADGYSPAVASIAWATVNLKTGQSWKGPFVSFYCDDELHLVPKDLIGRVDGIECVFFLSEELEPHFHNKVLDWTEAESWVLRLQSGEAYMPTGLGQHRELPQSSLGKPGIVLPANENGRRLGALSDPRA